MKEIVNNFKRQDLFTQYNNKENPFSFITVKLDITKAFEYAKVNKNLYAILVYVFTKSMNEIPEFKYRVLDGKIVKFDKINPNYTELLDNGDVGFIGFPFKDNLDEYIKYNQKIKAEFKRTQKSIIESPKDEAEVWLSCLPWFKFTGVIPPFDKAETTPQIIWDKYEIVDNHVYVNAMIMAHHGFVDGSHIGKLIAKINENMSKIGAN